MTVLTVLTFKGAPKPVNPSVESSLPTGGECPEIPAFSLRTKVCIYGSAAATVSYIIYNYWHLILMCLGCLLLYEIWDKFGHRFTSSKKKAE